MRIAKLFSPSASKILFSPLPASESHLIVILGKKKSILHSSITVENIASLNLKQDDVMKIIERGPESDFTTFFGSSKIGAITKLLVGILPENYSRHNSASRSDIVYDLMVRFQNVIHDQAKSNASTTTMVNVHFITETTDNPMTAALPLVVAGVRAFPVYNEKTDRKYPAPVIHVNWTGNSPGAAHDIIKNIAESSRFSAGLVDLPANKLDTISFKETAEDVVSELKQAGFNVDLTMKIGEELKNEGFGGMWGVGKAAEKPPVLAVLTFNNPHAHSGNPAAKKVKLDNGPGSRGINNSHSDCIAMVGKGIIFDTGGLSLKPTAGMMGMKADCGGAASTLFAFRALVLNSPHFKEQLPSKLVAALCLAENAIGPLALRNDDIVTLKSGKSVEINNTDAEGRLVLGDGVFHVASTFNPSVVIDMATLTGAQLIATGKRVAAVYTNDDACEDLSISAGKRSGEVVFPLVYAPEFHKAEFASTVADMKNSVAARDNAQSSCAGQFILNHLPEGFRYIHIDIAGPAFLSGRATGYGVALYHEIITSFNSAIAGTKE